MYIMYDYNHHRVHKNIVYKKKQRSGITTDPSGHRPQRPCAQGRTCAKQEQAPGAAPGQIQNRTPGGVIMSGRTTKQAGEAL